MPFVTIADHVAFSLDKLRKVALFEAPRLLLDVYCLLPGQAQKVHSHDDIDKVYCVLSGQAVATLGDEARALGPGQAAVAPAGMPHGLRNDGSEPATVLVFQARGEAE